MPTVIPNDALKSVLLKTYMYNYKNSSDDVSVVLFEGAPPSKADLIANVDSWHADGWAVFTSGIKTWITDTHGTPELATCTFSDFYYQEHTEFTKVKLSFSRRPELFTPTANGTAGWFMIICNSGNGAFTGGYVRYAAVGTVGALGSGADLELSNPVISTTQELKINDITIDFNIQGVIS